MSKHKHVNSEQEAWNENVRLRELIAFVGQHIRLRAANMSWMTKSCRMCTGTKLRRENCRHDEILQIWQGFRDAEAQQELASVERLIGEEAAD
jgi:hypothetical protein